MRKGWSADVAMGTLCSIDSGSSNAQDAVDGAPYVLFDRSKKIKRSTRYLFDCEALIIPGEGTEFLPRHYIGKFDLHQRAYALHSFSERIDVKYLYYYLIYRKDYWPHVAVGATVKSLRRRHFENLPVILAPPNEQQRIVAILDEAFAGLATATANAEKNVKNARELFDSYLNSAFRTGRVGWTERLLGDQTLLEIIDGDRGANYPKKTDFSGSGHCLFLNTKNVRPDGFDFRETMFISEKKDKELRKGKLKRNDVILTTRGTVGNAAVYDQSVPFENIRMNSGMLIFRPRTEKILPRYLFECFRSGMMKTQIARHVSGAAQPQLPIKTLVKFAIPVPDNIEDQQRLTELLSDVSAETSRLESAYEVKISNLGELKQSILQKAFSGELTFPPSQAIKEAAE